MVSGFVWGLACCLACVVGLQHGGLQYDKLVAKEVDFLEYLAGDPPAGLEFCMAPANHQKIMTALEAKCCCTCAQPPYSGPPDNPPCVVFPPGPNCSAWADPHISSFDNVAGEQGPEYLSLASNKGKANVTYYHTTFSSFDKMQSKIQRRTKNVSTTTRVPANEIDRTLDANAYETGDFWLVKSRPVHIQGRFRLAQEFLPDNAAIGAVSIGGPFLGGHVLTIEPLDGDATLDGAPMPGGSFMQNSEAGNLSMTFHPGNKTEKLQPHADFNAALPLGVSVTIRRWLRHLDLKIHLGEEIPGGVDGECGNSNGNTTDDGSDHIENRMGDVRVNETDKLFTKNFPIWVNTDKEGFEAVQATGDSHSMAKFIRLVLAARGAQLMSEAKLSGIVPYYTGDVERNSYSDLMDELKTADWVKGWDRGSSWQFGSILDRIFQSFG